MNTQTIKTYLVGGAVRDHLLGLPVKDRDWVVVGADAQTMLAQGYQPVGRISPYFSIRTAMKNNALARTERKNRQRLCRIQFSCR